MRTRIDHATVITCRGNDPVILDDHSVEFRDGVITCVEPSGRVEGETRGRSPQPLARLRGRPLGAILLGLGRVTEKEIEQALESQQRSHVVIGQELVRMGCVSEADVEYALAIQAGRIEEPAGDEDLTLIDGRDCVVIPGLVNAHHHLFQSLTRCHPAAQNARLFDWLVSLYPRWQRLDYQTLRQAAMVSIAELLLTGCTTTSDHMYLFPPDSDVAAEAVIEAADMMGIRIHLCRGSMTLGQSAGGLPPDECVETDERVLEDSVRVIERFHDTSPLAMRRIDLAPCAPFNITPELLDRTRDLAAERGVLLHTHLAETLDEERYCLDRFGVRPVEYLRQHGWLGANTYLAHCVHLNDEEIGLLAATSTAVTHCPCSNMRLGSGIAPVRRMLTAGVRVGLGVDGSSSNDGANLLNEARQAMLLQRVAAGPDAMTAAEAFRLATVGSASVLNRPVLGRIEPGFAADLAVYDACDVALAGASAYDPLATLVFCEAPRPREVFVAGRRVVEGGRMTGLELAGLVRDFNQMVGQRFR